ncbi:MAG: hypothetical protein V7L30_17385 [Nostoc sp.]
MKIINLKDAINRRLYKRLIIVETPIHRVSCLNRTVLNVGALVEDWNRAYRNLCARRKQRFRR